MTEYSNPRKSATFLDWPSGKYRVTCEFSVESNKKGERFKRVTTNPKTGLFNAPKTTTYCLQAFIVDGDDGRTYLMEWNLYGFISVMSSDMVHSHETIHGSEDSERFQKYKNLCGIS